MLLHILKKQPIDKTIHRNFILFVISMILIFIGAYVFVWKHPPKINLNEPTQNRAGFRPDQRIRIEGNFINGEEILDKIENDEEFDVYVVPFFAYDAELDLEYLKGYKGIMLDASNDSNAYNIISDLDANPQELTTISFNGELLNIDYPQNLVAYNSLEELPQVYHPYTVRRTHTVKYTSAFIIAGAGTALGLYSFISMLYCFNKDSKSKKS